MQVSSPGRSVSVDDLLRNVAGAALGLVLHRLYRLHKTGASRVHRHKLIAIGTIISVAVLFPAMWAATAYAHRSNNWPNVIGHNYRLERVFTAAYESEIEIIVDPGPTVDGSGALLLRLGECVDCGILFQELGRDWTGLSRECLELTNLGSAPLALSVRLGTAPMFFRSTDTRLGPITLPPHDRVTECLALSEFSAFASAGNPPTAPRSAALLADGPHATREILIHRVWFE
jgi:hypothetical protein